MKLNSFAKLVLLINIIGLLFGIYYYIPKLSQTNPILWPLVPDSPLSILFFILVFLGIWRGGFAAFFASAWLIKYGIWTVFVMLFYSGYYLVPELLASSWALFIIPHIGMALEAVLIMKPKFELKFAIIALAILLANDFADYAVGTRPLIPDESIGVVAGVAVLLSIAACAFLYLFSKEALENKYVASVRNAVAD